ncbi:MAG: glycosyltransferase family 39 protein [Deltaproteobacteria bacterium]|nr:glycosyltransferase family 39 protein [Deltaproteobacteria bacterium]
MTAAARLGRVASAIGPAALAVAGLGQLALLLYAFGLRVFYPLDLEWMEGGVLTTALRILEGKPVYAEPSADFISFLYTPFYPTVVAGLGKVFGLSYPVGRVVSVLAFLGACALIFEAVRRAAGKGRRGVLYGLGSVGLVASSYPHVGGWYDLVRGDSLYLALITAALFLLAYKRTRWPYLALAGALMGLAFLTKQTATLFIVASGALLLLLDWRRVWIYVASVGLVAGGTVLWLNRASDGWFWKYVFRMHQGHDLYWERVWPQTELTLLKLFPAVGAVLGLWLVVALGQLAFTRRLPPEARRPLYGLLWAVVGIAVSAVGFATQWADVNAYIPGLVFAGAFAPLAVADLERRFASRPLVAGLLALLLGGVLAGQLVHQLYRPAKLAPTLRDRRWAGPLIERLRSVPGPVLMPYHPFYPVLAGKPSHYHQMGVNDVTRAGHPYPPQILQRIANRHYGAIVLDNPVEGRYEYALNSYKFDYYFHHEEVPYVVSGYFVRPRYLLVPKRREPAPPGVRRLFDFESGTYDGFTVTGSAFGARPAGGPWPTQGMSGPFEGLYLASSYGSGDPPTGRLRSPEFPVETPKLSYRVGGGNLPGQIEVRLLLGERVVHRGTGTNSHIMEERVVDVSAYRGQRLRLELVDEATGSWGHLLFDELCARSR